MTLSFLFSSAAGRCQSLGSPLLSPISYLLPSIILQKVHVPDATDDGEVDLGPIRGPGGVVDDVIGVGEVRQPPGLAGRQRAEEDVLVVLQVDDPVRRSGAKAGMGVF